MRFDLSSLGWDDALAHAYRRLAGTDCPAGDAPWSGCRPARVTRVDRGVCSLLTEYGAERASLGGPVLGAAATDPTRLPAAGDWVVSRTWPDRRTTIEAVLPRRSAVVRSTAGVDALSQILAANVDVAAVVAAVDPEPDLGRIERLLALAWNSGARPMIILTKADLAADPQSIVDEVSIGAPGVDVVAVSATTGAGLDRLRPLVQHGRTLGLVGASGAGKSTLVNALVGTPVMAVQAIRDADGKGRHTTAYRALIPVPGGGAVLDTPGLRGIGLTGVDQPGGGAGGVRGLDRAFADITELAAACRFTDCRHDREPGCAVTAAVDAGRIPARRIDSWRRLHQELVDQTRLHEARLAGQARTRWRNLARQRRIGGARP
jgi:ribosome biogenesis GTPase / thiamine phosphate phosphatase